MWRGLAVFFGLLAICLFEFQVYPGHGWLTAQTRIYLPILQHLASPGYLSRDLLVLYPNVTFTAYDEITLFLHREAKLDFEHALLLQQFLSRLAGLLGAFLLARLCGSGRIPALAAAALVGLGAYLPGVCEWLTPREPAPASIAFGFLLLAMGCVADAKPLAASFFGGLGLIYDPVLASPFWLTALVAFLFDRQLRRSMRPALPILLVFILLLANLAQLQPGTPDGQQLWARCSREFAAIVQFRTPEAWIAAWPKGSILLYLAMAVVCAAAVTRLWPSLPRQARWLFTLLPALALGSIAFSYLAVDRMRWTAALRAQPASMLLYLVFLTWLACAILAGRTLAAKRKFEAGVWLSGCALLLLLKTAAPTVPTPVKQQHSNVDELARWAADATWGGSVFLFADSGRASDPSVFRAEARRAVWVDWASGSEARRNPDFASEWFRRWRTTLELSASGPRLTGMLSLPIDYYVFRRSHVVETELHGRLRQVRAAYANRDFVVYEASLLRLVPGRLRIVNRS